MKNKRIHPISSGNNLQVSSADSTMEVSSTSTSAELWLNLQTNYSLWAVSRKFGDWNTSKLSVQLDVGERNISRLPL